MFLGMTWQYYLGWAEGLLGGFVICQIPKVIKIFKWCFKKASKEQD